MQFWNYLYDAALSPTGIYASVFSSSYNLVYLNTNLVSIYSYFTILFVSLISIIDLAYAVISDCLSSNMLDSIIIAFKFLLLIALLVFIRGGIPRYRFDHLTKMGWIKFLSLVLASILIEMLLIWVF